MNADRMHVPRKYRDHWARPWTKKASRSIRFRLWLARHQLLSPHFSYAEAASKDGTPIPRRLRTGARNHAFQLERLRHRLNDKPMAITSWYRSPAHNRHVGGAAKSKHLQAIATDFDAAYVRRHRNFDKQAEIVFGEGGFGEYPGGARHVDTRGYRARWTTFTPGR